MMTETLVDIKEDDILALSPELLNTLLRDNTLSTAERQVNIFWATDNYADRGEGYQYYDQITIDAITGENGDVIVPRAVKSRQLQKRRSREMAEVFTPSWLCNKMNNLVDGQWLGHEGAFNTEVDDFSKGTHSWIVNPEPVTFPEGKTWIDYINDNQLEITCGEAPFLVSRYDTVSGEPIPLERRIGLLDRKLRVVGENTSTYEEWLDAATAAFQSTYGYEWQGDNIVLAREALLYTFIEYHRAGFDKEPPLPLLLKIADIISWNIWQMDGLKGVIPNSCSHVHETQSDPTSLFSTEDFGEERKHTVNECPGCRKKNIHAHTGIYAKIRDWKENEILTFASMIKRK